LWGRVFRTRIDWRNTQNVDVYLGCVQYPWSD
jgi:hypothetical protein